MNELGNNIKKLREAKKISQPVLADKLDVTRSTISAYENGTRMPSYDVLINIARLFHVSIDNLLGFSNKYSLDVSDLTQKQRNTIQEILVTYKRHNSMYRNIMESDSIVNVLKDMGLVDEFEDWLEDK